MLGNTPGLQFEKGAVLVDSLAGHRLRDVPVKLLRAYGNTLQHTKRGQRLHAAHSARNNRPAGHTVPN